MGTITRERKVLKLVHPGRYVEIHQEPISAAEIMRKNPRHCITRPDVFKFPWIVVKPESTLNLGRVFFIVPNHTIYHMLKARGHHNQSSSSQQSQSPKNNVHHQVLEQNSTVKSYAGMTSKQQNHSQYLEQKFKAMSLEHDCSKRSKKQSQVESWPEVITKYKNTYLQHKKKLLTDSTIDIRSSHDKDYHFSDSSISAKLPKPEDGALEKCSKQVSILKSCIRKPESDRKSLHLRVSFVLPIEDEEQQKKVIES